MTTDKLIKGLQILQPYYGDTFSGQNAHFAYGAIYVYVTPKPLTKADILKMIELGWEQDHEDELSLSNYRQDEAWLFFT